MVLFIRLFDADQCVGPRIGGLERVGKSDKVEAAVRRWCVIGKACLWKVLFLVQASTFAIVTGDVCARLVSILADLGRRSELVGRLFIPLAQLAGDRLLFPRQLWSRMNLRSVRIIWSRHSLESV